MGRPSGQAIKTDNNNNSIKQQTGYSFFWDQQLLNKAPLISISVTDVPITEALDKVLKGLPLTYELKGKIAFITAKNSVELTPASTIQPDANYDVSGIVKDEKGHPLQGASLRLLPFTQQQQTNAAYDPPAGLTSSSLRPAMPIVTDNVQNYLSWIANASYSIDGKYIFNAGLRSDASNRFGQYTNNRIQPAYSLSGRWNIAAAAWISVYGR